MLAAVVYPPLLATAPGQVVADTKTYLYLDPGRLLSRALSMWDPHVGLGTVPHQQIGYLWPIGPYYWLCETIGLPDWVAQRLWIGTILVAAGGGVLFLARTWRWRLGAATAAAFVYALSPFVLTLAARISVILLPFAGLPWLLALAVRSLRTKGWRHPALFGLTVATVGSVNATAILLVGLVPVAWILYATWSSERFGMSRAATTIGKIGLVTLLVNLWWIGGLSVQATNGIDVLRYTETAEVVARASTAPEVLRGLGYWFFYGGDRLGPWIEPGVGYTQHLWLLAVTYALPILGLAALGIVRWRHRGFLVLMLVLGTVVAVGAHPWGGPSPIGALIQAFLSADVGLAMRSLPRAVPIVALALALAIGTAVAAAAEQVPRRGALGAVAVVVLAMAAMPALWTGDFVPENLRRDEALPDYWLAAADRLDVDDGTRILEVPGSDFASYRWGNTVDPITPGLLDRPYAARELIPYGSPASADLLGAIDLRMQDKVFDGRGFAALARLLGVGDVVVRNDLQYERYNTPRPRVLWDQLLRAPGFEDAEEFGSKDRNRPIPEAALTDEEYLAVELGFDDPPAVGVLALADPLPMVRLADPDRTVILDGDGAGLVDVADAGLIDGSELIRYAADLTGDPDFAVDDLVGDRALIVTDTNRRRGQRWNSVRHVMGYTEQATGEILADDATDNRLPLFADRPGIQTVARHVGVAVSATAYGNPITFAPEERPVLAADGDPSTAWRVAAFDDAVGERIELTADDPVQVASLTLLQPIEGEINRWITDVEIRFDGRDPLRVALDESSRSAPGQVVAFDERTVTQVSIEILADTAGRRPGYGGLTSVGFAEIDLGGLRAEERIVMPSALLDAAGYRSQRYPLALVQTRLRSIATDLTRDDEERSITREVTLPTERTLSLTGTARLSGRADAAALEGLLGQRGEGLPTVRASSVLDGSLTRLPANVLDGDPRTTWTAAIDLDRTPVLTVDSPTPIAVDRITLLVVDDEDHSVPDTATVRIDGALVADAPLELGPRDATGLRSATVAFPTAIGSELRVELGGADLATTIDWNSNRPEALPMSVAELDVAGLRVPRPAAAFDTGCRHDLLDVDGTPYPIRITGTADDAIAGRPLQIEPCVAPATLAGGTHVFHTAEGRTTGLDVDQLVWCSAAGGAGCAPGATAGTPAPLLAGGTSVAGPTIEVVGGDDATIEVHVEGATAGEPLWLVIGQSFNSGWQLVDPGFETDEVVRVNGYANGFLLQPDAASFDLTVRFAPQNRVDVLLLLSVIGLVAAIGMIVVSPKERGPAPIPLIEPMRRLRATTWEGALPTKRIAVLTGIAAGVAAGALIVPVAGPVVGIVTGFAVRRETWRPVFTLVPAALLGICALYLIGLQFRNQIEPGLHWPEDSGRLHPYGLLAVVLLGIDVAIEQLWWRRSEYR